MKEIEEDLEIDYSVFDEKFNNVPIQFQKEEDPIHIKQL